MKIVQKRIEKYYSSRNFVKQSPDELQGSIDSILHDIDPLIDKDIGLNWSVIWTEVAWPVRNR